MKVTELRIGNYLKRLDDSVFDVNSEDIQIIERWDSSEDLLPKPIPLTEEWLIKFGFRKNIGYYKIFGRFKDRTLELGLNNDTSEVQYYVYVRGFENDNFVSIRHDLKHIHQLQNLYFALTGEELTIKE